LLKRSTSQSDIVIEEKVTVTKTELKVMLLGKLENPKIECLRELYHKESDCKLIPLGVKKSQPTQKFRIPFKNTSISQDAEVEFTFVKLPHASATDDEPND
jgi:hypothetical protein